MVMALDDRVLRSKAQSLICAVGLGRAKCGLSAEDVDGVMLRLRRSCLRERVTGFFTNAGANLIVYLEGRRCDVARGLHEIKGNQGLNDVWLLAYARLSTRRFADIELGFFGGDAGGTQTLEASFLGCSRGDQALIDEALRIHSAGYSLTDSTNNKTDKSTRQVSVPVLITTDLTLTAN